MMADQIIRTPATARKALEFDQGKIRRDLLVRRVGKLGVYINPVFAYFFLWAPIVVLVLFSFNDGGSVSTWQGFTFEWYGNILPNAISAGTEAARFSTGLMLNAVRNSLIVSVTATILSTLIGVLVSLSLDRGRFPGKRALDAV